MNFRILLLIPLLTFSIIIHSFGQTCTSSGGDDVPIFDDPPYRFRCGTAMMNDRMYKVSKDFELIEGCDNYWGDGNYFNYKGKIYYSEEYNSHEVIVGVDAKSFRCENGTARDDVNIYFRGKVVPNVDENSFKSVGLSYCSDNNNVFYRNRYNESGKLLKVVGAKSSTFELIGNPNSNYAKDEESVYFSGKKIVSSDPESFIVLEYGYAHDKNFVYYNGSKVDGMIGSSFKVLKDCFLGSDGVRLCNGLKTLKNSDAKSFRAIECGYYKDNNNVYLNGTIIEEIDSESFQILSWGYTKDKKAVYCDLQLIVGANPATFSVLGRKHSKDSNNIYYLHETMDCDYKSFEVSKEVDYLSMDKYNTYSRGIKNK
jgi:hypothetical protein